jgi:hypothetical protein
MVLLAASGPQQAGMNLAPSASVHDSPLDTHSVVATSHTVPTGDSVLLAHLRPQLPEEILKLICSALNDMQPKVVPPSTGDPLIRKTFLSIQLVSQAGWRVATPYIWHTLKLANDKDYVSFFAPVSPFLNGALDSSLDGRWHEDIVAATGEENGSLPASLERFLLAVCWINSIVLQAAPPLSVQCQVENISELLHEIRGDHFITTKVHLFLSGRSSPSKDTEEGTLRLDLLETFVSAFEEVVSITVFAIPANYDASHRFWIAYGRLQSACNWDDAPLTIHHVAERVGWPISMPHKDTTFWLSDSISYRANCEPTAGTDDEIAIIVARAIFSRMHIHDTLFTSSSLQVKGWAGCPCGCTPTPYTVSEVTLVERITQYYTLSEEALIEMVIQYYEGYMEDLDYPKDNGLEGAESTFEVCRTAVKKAFEEGRIKLWPTMTCNDYKRRCESMPVRGSIFLRSHELIVKTSAAL